MRPSGWRRGPRLLAAGAAFVVVLVSLVACQYLPRTAVRLNSDGTLDIASCETIDDVSSAEVDFYFRRSDDARTTVAPDVLPARLGEGTVLHVGYVPSVDTWDRLYFSVTGAGEREISGVFDLSSIQPDEWTWAKEGLPFNADVEHCDLNE